MCMYVCVYVYVHTQTDRQTHTHLSRREGMVDKEEDEPKGDAAHEQQQIR